MRHIEHVNYLHSSCDTVGALAPTIPEDKHKTPNSRNDFFFLESIIIDKITLKQKLAWLQAKKKLPVFDCKVINVNRILAASRHVHKQ